MTTLRTWDHVQEKNRPTDTGKRTDHGHRIIYNPGTGNNCIEYPFNSLQLISTDIYDKRLKMGVQDAAEDLLEALEALVDESVCLKADIVQRARTAIAKARGMQE